MSEIPLISVIIPTRNRASLVSYSIASALAQTYERSEILVSDNNSSDSTLQVMRQFNDAKLRIVHRTTDLPMMAHWNACISDVRGEYVLLLSDDDILEPNALRDLIAPYLNQQAAHVGAVIGRAAIIGDDGSTRGYTKVGPPIEDARTAIIEFFRGNRSNYPCANLLRREDVLALGRYDGERFSLGADGALWMLSALKRGTVAYVAQTVARYRQHSSNATTVSSIEEWLHASRALEVAMRDALGEDNSMRNAIHAHRSRLISNLTALRAMKGGGMKEMFSLWLKYRKSASAGISGWASWTKAFVKVAIS